jgi:hypothetical protein
VSPAGQPSEDMLDAMAEVMERQARVARAEAALAAARRRLGDSVARLSGVARDGGERIALPPFVAIALQLDPGLPAADALQNEERTGTLRKRIVAIMAASPGETFTPARLAPLVGSGNRDSVRNTLLVLAAKGQIDKLGAGLYRARQSEAAPSTPGEAAP